MNSLNVEDTISLSNKRETSGTQHLEPGVAVPSTHSEDSTLKLSEKEMLFFVIALLKGMMGQMISGDAWHLGAHMAKKICKDAGMDDEKIALLAEKVDKALKAEHARNPFGKKDVFTTKSENPNHFGTHEFENLDELKQFQANLK